MKSFTDIEQSRKLANILPHKSADMNYKLYAGEKGKEYEVNLCKYLFTNWVAIPCWSLAALLDIFPCSKESPIVNLTRGGWNPSFTRRWFATWEDENKNILYSCNGASPVDAVVELIMKLHEQNIL